MSVRLRPALIPSMRALRRHAVPGFVMSLYHYFKTGARVSPSARIQLSSKIRFGDKTVVKPYVIVQTTGGEMRFGRECALSSFSHFSTGAGDVIIGDYVRIAPNCTIVGGTKATARRDMRIIDQPEVTPNGIVIGDDVLIGANSVILPAVRIGTGAVIGAGSVVQGTIPEYAIAVGAPAKVIGHRGE
jgi:acetyltransferase-like isoleucine patch superfamily enzyme